MVIRHNFFTPGAGVVIRHHCSAPESVWLYAITGTLLDTILLCNHWSAPGANLVICHHWSAPGGNLVILHPWSAPEAGVVGYPRTLRNRFGNFCNFHAACVVVHCIVNIIPHSVILFAVEGNSCCMQIVRVDVQPGSLPHLRIGQVQFSIF